MDIPANEVVGTPKQIGHLGDSPVMMVALKGGLHIVTARRRGKWETLGIGPHAAVARFIAKKKESEVEYDDLTKSEHVDPSNFTWLLPRYERMTDDLRARQGL